METRLCTKYANNLEYILNVFWIYSSDLQMRGKRKSQANQRGSDSELSLLPTFIVCWGIILLDLCMQGIHQSLCSSGRSPFETESIRSFYILWLCAARSLAGTVFPILKIKHIGRLILLSFSGTTKKLISARKPRPGDCGAPIFFMKTQIFYQELELKNPQNSWRSK